MGLGAGCCVCKIRWLPTWCRFRYSRYLQRCFTSASSLSSRGSFLRRLALRSEPDAVESKPAESSSRKRALDLFPGVGSQFLLTVGLGEDALADGFSRIPAASFLCDLKYDLLAAVSPSPSQ